MDTDQVSSSSVNFDRPHQVMDFVRGVSGCEEYAELFSRENIDGAVLALLTDSHLQVNHHHNILHHNQPPEAGPGYEAGPSAEVARCSFQAAGELPPLQALQALP